MSIIETGEEVSQGQPTEQESARRSTALAILKAVAEADPQFPEDPNKFKYEGVRHPDNARAVIGDRAGNESVDISNIARNHRSSLANTLDLIEYPDGRSPQAVERALRNMEIVRDQNPRFADYSLHGLAAHLRPRLNSYDPKKERNSIRKIEAQERAEQRRVMKDIEEPAPPPINVVDYYKGATSLLDNLTRSPLPHIGDHKKSPVEEKVLEPGAIQELEGI